MAGITVSRQIANVTSYRDGLEVRTDSYGDWAQALEAIGLSGSHETRPIGGS
jgi:hypothetical protein